MIGALHVSLMFSSVKLYVLPDADVLSDNSFRVTRPSITVVHSNPKSHRIPPGGGGYVILPNSFHIKQNDNTSERAACYFAVNFFEACSLVKNKRHYLKIMNGRNELLNDFYKLT